MNDDPATPLRIGSRSSDARSPKMSTEGASDVASPGDAAHGRRHERHPEKPLRPSETAEPMPRVMRLPTVLRETGLARSTVYRMVAEHTFPAPVRLHARAIGWFYEDVEEWFASRPSTLRR